MRDVQVRLFLSSVLPGKIFQQLELFNDAMAAGHLPLPNIQHLAPSCILLPVQGQTSG